MESLFKEALDDFDDDSSRSAAPSAAAEHAVVHSTDPSTQTSSAELSLHAACDQALENMEASLRALAASAEKQGPDDSDSNESVLLAQLLQKLSNPAGSEPDGDAEQHMIDLLQQLSGLGVDSRTEADILGVGEAGSRTSAQRATSSANDPTASSESQANNPLDGVPSEDSAMDGLLDTLVGQLLSKEVMLEPMQHLHAEFPRYLESNASQLSAADLRRYRKQQELVGQILKVYQQTPNDTDRIAELMQEMQQQGPPPASISGPAGEAVGCSIS